MGYSSVSPKVVGVGGAQSERCLAGDVQSNVFKVKMQPGWANFVKTMQGKVFWSPQK